MYAKLSAAMSGAALAAVLLASAPARADLAAVYAQGHGGNSSAAGVSESGLGYRLGARLLIFEGYFEHTGFGEGAGVDRGVLGLRAGIGPDRLRLVLRAGAGMVGETGGALTGMRLVTPERWGPVARAGVALEGKIAPMFYLGGGVDTEAFRLPAAAGAASVTGTDVFLNLHLLFELGV
jgi:hypothetical protein